MAQYYLNNNTQPNGDREVHKEGCQLMPSDRTFLGAFSRCQDAVWAARLYHSQVNGCFVCSRECHTQ